MLYLKKAGIWEQAIERWINNASTWQEQDLWLKISGTWRQLVPPNAIILYDNIPSAENAGYLANGSNYTPNLLNKYITIASGTPLSLDGTSSHNGIDHGNATIYSINAKSSSSSTAGANPWGTDTSHNHSLSSYDHNHGGTIQHTPDRQELIPYIYGMKIESGALILAASDLSETFLTSAILNKLLYMASAYTSGGTGTAHNHNSSLTHYTNYHYDNNDLIFGGVLADNLIQHRHNMAHTPVGESLRGKYLSAKSYKTNTSIFFDQLPSNACILFMSNKLPIGWSRWKQEYGLLYSVSTNTGSYLGSITHNHTGNINTGNPIDTNTSTGFEGTINHYRRVNTTHVHSFTDNHSTLLNIMPPSIDLTIAIKS